MKTKYEIITALNKAYDTFCDYVIELEEEKFLAQPNKKWSPGQHTQHLVKSISPVTIAFNIPLFFFPCILRTISNNVRFDSTIS